jgi:multiple sugar transport system permease protein
MILMILPLQVTLVPNYIMLDQLHLLGSYASLILPSVFIPLGTFIITQGFKVIPDDIIDAAMLDGCSITRILTDIAIPMNKGGLICAGLLAFLDGWNMVEQPIAYLKDFNKFPISVALAYVSNTDSAIQLVCCILVILPPLFLFSYYNRELVEGITLGEVK